MLEKILELELIMVLLMLCGVWLRRRGVLTDAGQDCITDIMMQVILPCNIFLSFQLEVQSGVFRQFGATMLISVLIMVGVALLGRLLYGRKPDSQAKVFQYGLVNSNALFIGLPVVQSLLGDAGVVQQNMYMIFVRIICWSYGLSLYTGEKASWKQTIKKLFTHPCMAATLAGVGFMLLDLELPEFVRRTLSYCSSCLMALSMLLIGSILAGMKWRDLRRLDIWGFALVRLGVVPGLTWLGCRVFQTDPLVSATCVLMAGMPAASLTAVLAARYRGDAQLASLIVTVSTLISVVSIPLWFLILQ